jgi:hypothetical protein
VLSTSCQPVELNKRKRAVQDWCSVDEGSLRHTQSIRGDWARLPACDGTEDNGSVSIERPRPAGKSNEQDEVCRGAEHPSTTEAEPSDMPAHILREEECENQNDIAHKTNGLENVENDGQPSTELGIIGDGQACTRACPFMWSVSGWKRCERPLLYLSSKPLLLQSDGDCAAATRRNERARSSERSDWKLNRVGSVQSRSTQTE